MQGKASDFDASHALTEPAMSALKTTSDPGLSQRAKAVSSCYKAAGHCSLSAHCIKTRRCCTWTGREALSRTISYCTVRLKESTGTGAPAAACLGGLGGGVDCEDWVSDLRRSSAKDQTLEVVDTEHLKTEKGPIQGAD